MAKRMTVYVCESCGRRCVLTAQTALYNDDAGRFGPYDPRCPQDGTVECDWRVVAEGY